MELFAFFQNLGPMEMAIILFVGIMLFGKRLPDVGRSLGQGIVQFKRGLRGMEDEVNDAVNRPEGKVEDRVHVEAPRFDIPASSAKTV